MNKKKQLWIYYEQYEQYAFDDKSIINRCDLKSIMKSRRIWWINKNTRILCVCNKFEENFVIYNIPIHM